MASPPSHPRAIPPKCGAALRARRWRSRPPPIDRSKVKLHDMLLGGGFGRRGPRDMDFLVDAVLLSKAIGKPVKSMWTREDDIQNGRFRPLSAHLLKAGFNASGKLLAWQHCLVGDRVTPFADPVRYEKAGKKDFILMLGADHQNEV